MRRLVPLACVLPVLGIFSCRGERTAPPPVVSDTTRRALPALTVAMSRFDVPLEYDFTPIIRIVDRTVPTTFGSLDSVHVVGTDSGKHYAYTATRGPFTATMDGATVRLRTTLSYAARGYYKPRIGPTLSAGCGEDESVRPRITVELVAPLTLGNNWHLVSKAAVAQVVPASSEERDRCMVSIIHYDVTDRVVEAARNGLTAQLPKIDRQVASVNLTKLATGWWGLLNRPIHLTDSVWLMLKPQQLRLGKMTGAGQTLTVRVGLDAKPVIITGREPVDSVPPLPALAHESVSHGYHIMLDGLVDYATASRGVTAAVGQQTFTHGGQTVRIRTIEATPTEDGRLALTVRFTGDTDGWLRLIGSPHYDARRGVLTVPDLDYDISTSNQLVNAYAWLRSESLRTQFREMAHVSVQPALDRGKSLLLLGLNRKLGDAVTLSATVDSIAVRGVYVTPAGLLARAEAIGEARMSVRQR